MKKAIMMIAALAMAVSLSACGNSATDSELVGQVKKTLNNTPLIFPDYKDADVSLGIIRKGVGSMSSQDVWVRMDDPAMFAVAKAASESGDLVKITYDHRRFVLYGPARIAKKIEVIK